MSKLKKSIEFETTFGRYVASEIIGEGGTGKVYKAESDAGQNVAVKVLDPAKSLSTERRGRFKNELLFGTRNQHPNIVTVIDHGPLRVGSSIAPFYVMPLYDSSLREAVRAGIPPATTLTHFSQILDGVEAAHLQRVVHRDLKPENILFDSGRKQWVIADCGVAEFAEEELYTVVDTKPGTRLANFQYAAPEQRVRGGRTDLRTDIFALGLILNEMFTGAVPLGSGYKQRTGRRERRWHLTRWLTKEPDGDSRTVQELLGHADVSTTMYRQVPSRGPLGVRSPIDRL